jgi:quercetin dioxygenase-like cupin family protein
MRHFNALELETEINIRGIKTKKIVHHNNATIKIIMLDPNQAIPDHQVPVDVTFYVLSGSGTIKIEDEMYNVKENDVVLCPPNTVMSVSGNEDGMSFLNMKTPGIIVTK